MNKGIAIFLAAIGGLLIGFVAFEAAAGLMVRYVSSIPWGLMRVLALLLPVVGAVAAAVLTARRLNRRT